MKMLSKYLLTFSFASALLLGAASAQAVDLGFSLALVDPPDSALLGTDVHYGFQIGNYDPLDRETEIRNVALGLVFSRPVSLVSYSAQSGTTCSLADPTSFFCPNFAFTGATLFDLGIRPLEAGELTAYASVGVASDTNLGNNTAIVTLTIRTTIIDPDADPTIPPPIGDGDTIIREGSGAYYNQIVQPQFVWEYLRGDIAVDGIYYFSTSADEIADISALHPFWDGAPSPLASVNPNNFSGGFDFYRLTDRCRTAACGETLPDHKSTVIGIPLTATNAYYLGNAYDCSSPSCEFTATPDRTDSPFHTDFEGWQGRNYITTDNFRYSRYLIRIAEDDPTTSDDDDPIAGMSLHYAAGSSVPDSPNYLDCPHNYKNLIQGFTCPEIAAIYGYKSNPDIAARPGNLGGETDVMDEEARIHHKQVLEMVRDRLASEIGNQSGPMGDLYAFDDWSPDGFEVTRNWEMSEIAMNIYSVLADTVPQLQGADCRGVTDCLADIAARLSGDRIGLWIGPVTNNTYIDYNHEERRIYMYGPMESDCLSRRGANADSRYNTHDCFSFSANFYDGELLEDLFDREEWQLYFDTGNLLRAEQIQGVSAVGFTCFTTPKIAHELVHAYFQRTLERNRMETWPSSEALYEEELAVMTEAEVFHQMNELGFCPDNSEMQMKEYIQTVELTETGTVRGADPATRFYYSFPPRGYQGTFLGPYYTNMKNISKSLRNRDPELSRTLAYFHMSCPNMDRPEQMLIDGVVSDYVGEPLPGGEGPPAVIDPPVIDIVPLSEGGTP